MSAAMSRSYISSRNLLCLARLALVHVGGWCVSVYDLFRASELWVSQHYTIVCDRYAELAQARRQEELRAEGMHARQQHAILHFAKEVGSCV